MRIIGPSKQPPVKGHESSHVAYSARGALNDAYSPMYARNLRQKRRELDLSSEIYTYSLFGARHSFASLSVSLWD